MANLDGSRKNGAKHEVEVAARLLSEPGELATRYQLILDAARDAGIGSDRLPDFLSLEGGDAEVFLLGQEEQRMLVASHIKPWRDCTPVERLDARNGLTACPNHDAAFDTGLMTINGGLRIHVAPALMHSVRDNPAARAVFGRPPLGERLLIPASASRPRIGYLRWHHDNIYRSSLSAAP